MTLRLTPIFCAVSCVIAGLAMGYCLFSPGEPEFVLDVSEIGWDRVASRRAEEFRDAVSRQPKSNRPGKRYDDRFGHDPAAAAAAAAQPGAVVIDWDNERAHLPLSYLEQLDVAGFTSESESPWNADTEVFVISPELNEILQLDEHQRDAVQAVLLDARQEHVASRWAKPAALNADGSGVVIEIAPATSEVESSIRDSLIPIMGENRTKFFLSKIQSTLDWEYGGFGSARRMVEVSILPDDTISIRESLRHPLSGTAGQPHWHGDEEFELKSRQHRVDHLPASIAALVRIKE
jgi:hypothetical protein